MSKKLPDWRLTDDELVDAWMNPTRDGGIAAAQAKKLWAVIKGDIGVRIDRAILDRDGATVDRLLALQKEIEG